MPMSGLPATEKLGFAPVEVPRGHLLGAHMSIAGGMPLAIERAVSLGATAVQLFVKNNNRWEGKIISDDEAATFRAARAQAGDMPVVAHNCYLINMASPDEALRERSIAAMVDEIERCHLLGIGDLVAHPGAHMGEGEEAGIERIADSLNEAIVRTSNRDVRVLLETTAGQGSSIGHRFEHIAELVRRTRRKKRIGVCLDTAHIFAAGYDLRTATAARHSFAAFDEIIGLGHLRAIHLNDSKREFGSRVDRHEGIGCGYIGQEGFRWIIRSHKLRAIPKLLETPKGAKGELDFENMATLVGYLA